MLLLAAETAIGIADITPVVSAVGSLGFAIWFAYYTTTTTLPNQQKEHRDQIKELTESHAATIKDFVDELKDKRESHAETIKELVNELKATREAHERWRTSH